MWRQETEIWKYKYETRAALCRTRQLELKVSDQETNMLSSEFNPSLPDSALRSDSSSGLRSADCLPTQRDSALFLTTQRYNRNSSGTPISSFMSAEVKPPCMMGTEGRRWGGRSKHFPSFIKSKPKQSLIQCCKAGSCRCWLLTFIHYRGQPMRKRSRGRTEVLLGTLPHVSNIEQKTVKLLPSSSSSDVMDLERMDRAVVGARFGGGGAEEESERWATKQNQKNCRSFHLSANTVQLPSRSSAQRRHRLCTPPWLTRWWQHHAGDAFL